MRAWLRSGFWLLLLAPVVAAQADSAGRTGSSGAPGSASCDGCHATGAYSATASFVSPTTTVAPSSTTQYTLQLAGGGAPGGGFDVSATGGALAVCSSGTNANCANTQLLNSEITHTSTRAADGSGNITWAFNWTAPSTPGSYTLYTCAEPVNNDAATTGDGPVQCTTAGITVQAPNTAPTAADDAYSTPFNTTLSQAAPGVLANDTDADSDPLTAVLQTDVSHGTLTLNSNGSFSYTPTGGYNGSDSFTYKASDGTAQSSTATVQITIANNQAPVAAADSYSTPQGSPLTVSAPGVLSNDTDGDGDALTAVKVSNPTYGAVALSANGSFIYTPNTGYYGYDSFTYQANDGTANSNVATVTITITTNGSGGGYGGAPGPALLALFGLAALARRINRVRVD